MEVLTVDYTAIIVAVVSTFGLIIVAVLQRRNKADTKDLSGQVDALKEQVDNLKEFIDKRTNFIEELEGALQEERQKRRELEQKVEKLQDRIMELERENKALKKQLGTGPLNQQKG